MLLGLELAALVKHRVLGHSSRRPRRQCHEDRCQDRATTDAARPPLHPPRRRRHCALLRSARNMQSGGGGQAKRSRADTRCTTYIIIYTPVASRTRTPIQWHAADRARDSKEKSK